MNKQYFTTVGGAEMPKRVRSLDNLQLWFFYAQFFPGFFFSFKQVINKTTSLLTTYIKSAGNVPQSTTSDSNVNLKQMGNTAGMQVMSR